MKVLLLVYAGLLALVPIVMSAFFGIALSTPVGLSILSMHSAIGLILYGTKENKIVVNVPQQVVNTGGYLISGDPLDVPGSVTSEVAMNAESTKDWKDVDIGEISLEGEKV